MSLRTVTTLSVFDDLFLLFFAAAITAFVADLFRNNSEFWEAFFDTTGVAEDGEEV
jgi:hypothetical protein